MNRRIVVQCRDCQALMLEEAYGLLDAAAATAMAAHAAACAPCTAAVAETRALQSLIAKAAKLSFPNVTFAPPLAEVAKPVDVPQRQRQFQPWSIAASVLIVGGALTAALMQDRTGPAGQGFAKVEPSNPIPNGRGLPENGGNDHPIVIVQSHDWVKAASGERPAFKVKVTGNDALTAGVPNEYSVLAFDAADRKAKVQFSVTLKDAKDAVLFTKQFVNSAIVMLPVKEGVSGKLTLHVLAKDANGVTVEMSETLKIVVKK